MPESSALPLRTPVVIVAFNRPAVVRRTVEAVLATAPEDVFLVVDGPRATHPEDAARCAEVRELLTSAPWPGRVHTRFAERNIGLEANVELGLDWVFAQVDRAIVLEDDCIPHPTFFDFCVELLDRYAAEPRVWQVAGDNKGIPRGMFGSDSYAFTTWASVWGWATWADRWHAHRAVFPRDHAGAEERVGATPRTADAVRPVEVLPHPDALVTEAALRHFTQVAGDRDGDSRGWDHHWWVTIMSRRGLSITPSLNLVENDGFGPDATHTHTARDPMPAQEMPFPLVHPAEVALNEKAEAELELVLLQIDGRLSRAVKRIIKPLWMRVLIGRVVRFRPVWAVVRRLVAR
ncbi:glycosyltransferase [Pimelobacter simplex]|uniref:glycosyltransferase n=1 Tax=Nocardioides simplex TaxID=2045 RepID=UPI00214FE1B9|nr:glycosyltransferase [Pimelobacter simplex]UUW90048.1 glycosyltransferase [Pimelobacter simplex]UUW93877.1 glycosyltransferase [Pimelobacter simplex]